MPVVTLDVLQIVALACSLLLASMYARKRDWTFAWAWTCLAVYTFLAHLVHVPGVPRWFLITLVAAFGTLVVARLLKGKSGAFSYRGRE